MTKDIEDKINDIWALIVSSNIKNTLDDYEIVREKKRELRALINESNKAYGIELLEKFVQQAQDFYDEDYEFNVGVDYVISRLEELKSELEEGGVADPRQDTKPTKKAFYELPEKERAKIIKKAAVEGAKLQKEII